tara:strand:- start:246 stop:878 length:633 start_codon:yes stop_codon:yes gene_type:complete
MSDPKKENEAEFSREKLLDKIKILEDRLLQKEELIGILKEYNQKFIRQSEKLTTILEKQQQSRLNEREQFLLKKVEQLISKNSSWTDYEKSAISDIERSVAGHEVLSSFLATGDPITSAAKEIEFYRDLYIVEDTQDKKVNSKSSNTSNPFQKTIERIKTSEPPEKDQGQLQTPPINLMTDSRGDELDESINKTMNSHSSAKPQGRLKIS